MTQNLSAARAAWAQRIIRAFPDMTTAEVREAVAERFGSSISNGKISKARRLARVVVPKEPEPEPVVEPEKPAPATPQRSPAEKREQYEARVAAAIVEFFRSHHAALKAVIVLPDYTQASKLLRELRETFWSNF